MKKYDVAVYIGRFQPYHKGHQYIIEKASEIAKNIIVLIGSVNKPRTIKDPFTFDERCSFIPKEVNGVTVFKRPIKDFLYNDSDWIMGVQSTVNNTMFDDFEEPIDPNDAKITIIGFDKDDSTYYLKMFPQWDYTGVDKYINLNATALREEYFLENEGFLYGSINSVNDFLTQFKQTENFTILKEEYKFIEEYKAKSKFVGFSYPPIFVTADTVVICKGHILLVKRKSVPGKGLWALPGGFIKENELIRNAAIRELREETRIKVDKGQLFNSIRGEKVFDAPSRSLRGRTITHAFFIHLNMYNTKGLINGLPEIKGSDDAEVAKWFPLIDFFEMEDKMFEDHWHIGMYFAGWGDK